jgi:hypothetical protein
MTQIFVSRYIFLCKDKSCRARKLRLGRIRVLYMYFELLQLLTDVKEIYNFNSSKDL